MVVELTKDNFNDVINSGKVVMVDFWAEWCMPCKIMEPVTEELGKEMDPEKVVIAKCNVQSQQELAQRYSIFSIPSMLIFKNGKVMDQVVGAVPKKVLEDKIKTNIE
ncbi:MAG: thioredoxin [Candidatus Cloacimonadia bacterium]